MLFRSTELFKSFLEAFDLHRMKILTAIEKGKTLAELTALSPFYNNRFLDRRLQNYFEEHMALENLQILIEQGLVVEHNGIYTTVS